MATVVNGERQPFGPIINDITGLAITRRQIGGEGICRWKMLMNGMHLDGHWNCVEYVVIEPGASVGEHVHVRTEEIYYIIEGNAVMKIEGVEHDVRAGDLITTPIGCSHAIANRSKEDMHFFVTEVFPGQGPASPSMQTNLRSAAAELSGGHRAVECDLRPHFTGDWRSFSLIELDPGASDESARSSTSRVLHVLDGSAEIVIGDEVQVGGKGLSISIPSGLSHRVRNSSDTKTLRFIVTELTVAA